MSDSFKNLTYFVFLLTVFSAITFSCANRGSGPQGGPQDTVPPILLKSSPEDKSVNFSKNRLEFYFNEIVLIENGNEKISISPAQKTAAQTKAYGKKVVVQFNDSMHPNTTYFVNFSDAIVDNNEKNPLKNFSVRFSTGQYLDTFRMAGYLLDAQSLTPQPNVVIGGHTLHEDTMFTAQPFEILTKTDENGYFCFQTAKENTTYKIFALKEQSPNYFFDQKTEQIAFLDTLFRPMLWTQEKCDTVWADSLTIDTVRCVQYLEFRPNDIVLRLFQEENFTLRLLKGERKKENFFTLFFSAPQDTLPRIEPLNFTSEREFLIDESAGKDTITYWITDTLLWKTDTLQMAVHHPKTDSLGELIPTIDTLNVILRRPPTKAAKPAPKPRLKKKEEEADTVKKIEFVPLKIGVKRLHHIYEPILLTFEAPMRDFDSTKLHVFQKQDTLWNEVEFGFSHDKVQRKFTISHDWKAEGKYKFEADSAAFYDYQDRHTNKQSSEFEIKSLEDYSNLYVNLINFTGKEIFILLDKDEKKIKELKAEKETAFELLDPGEYYLKLYIDENENGKWDTGKYEAKLQPEPMFFFKEKIVLRPFWDIEQEWDYLQIPLTEQKPKELYQKKEEKYGRNSNY